MVQSGDKVGDVLGDVHLVEPGAVLQLLGAVGQVGAEHAVDNALPVGLVKALQAVGEDGVGGVGENPLGLALLQVVGNVQHGLAGGDDVVGDEHVLAGHVAAQVLVGHNGVAAVHHTGVVPALVEHAQLHPQHGGVVHVPVQGALVGGDNHKVIPLGRKVGEVAEHGFQHLIGRHQVVKAHQGHSVLHTGVVGVKGDHVVHAHGLQLLQREGAVQRFPVAAAVLPSAVEQGHHHGDAVGLAHGGLDKPLQVLVMVVGGHVVLLAKVLVGAAVVAHIHHKVQVIAPHGALQNALAIAGGEPGAAAANAEGVDVHPRLVCPPYQVRLDFVRQLLGALHGDNAKGRHTVFGTEKKLSRLFHMQAFPFFSGICLENTGALGQGFPPPFSS